MSALLEKMRKKRGSIHRGVSVLVWQVGELCVAADVDKKQNFQLRTLKSESLEKKNILRNSRKKYWIIFMRKTKMTMLSIRK